VSSGFDDEDPDLHEALSDNSGCWNVTLLLMAASSLALFLAAGIVWVTR